MKGPQEQYTDELKNYFGYYATWNPGLPLKLGYIGVLKDNVFTKISQLSERGITFEDEPDITPTDLEYNSKGNVSIMTKLSGTVAPQGSALTNADVGIIVEFGKESSTLFKANKTLTPTIKDTIKLGDQILKLYGDGKWNKNWVIITELVTAESATIVISNNTNGKIELKANANVNATKIDIADAKFEFSTQFSKGLDTKIVAEAGLTPLFKVMGIKTRIFRPPIFKPQGVAAFDLLTPETAKGKHKNEIYFGYISPDERE